MGVDGWEHTILVDAHTLFATYATADFHQTVADIIQAWRLSVLAKLLLATLLGGAIGIERE